MKRWLVSIRRRFARGLRLRASSGERGVTMIELAIMSLIVTIVLVAVTDAIRNASKGTLMAKEKARAMTLARDRIEEVKNMGYAQLQLRVSRYVWPDQPDPAHPLYQRKDAKPYPATAPSIDVDPWTPEVILLGNVRFWRHVKIKFVKEAVSGGDLEQDPDVSVDGIGGINTASNLAMIEVDLTWESRRTGRMEQVRLTTLLANTGVTSNANGSISGTIYDDDCGGINCVADGIDGGTADDKVLTWGEVVIMARNLNTGATYSAATRVGATPYGGSYAISGLPYGTYLVELNGGAFAQDSGYNATANPTYAGVAAVPVDVDMGNPSVEGINIWTNHAKSISVKGRFTNVVATPASPHLIRVSVNDGSSVPITWTITSTCSSSPPDECWFNVPNVAWPPSSSKLLTVTFEDLTAGTINTTQICADPTASPIRDVMVGADPALNSPPGNPCGSGAVCSGLGWPQCVSPNAGWLPISVTGAAALPASVHVKVLEYYNGTAQLFGDVSKVRVDFTALSAGVGVTRMVDSTGATTFRDPVSGLGLVPLAPAGDVTFRAYVTIPGWSMDSFALPFPTASGIAYDLETGGAGLQPPAEQRHTFVLQRVSEICGTIWEVPGVSPFKFATVTIRNAITGWTATVKCDNEGRFSHTAVPQEVGSYTIEPVTGADYVATPSSRAVTVSAQAQVYKLDNNNEPTEFTLNSVNAHIIGTVSKTTAGNLVKSGAVVIASTYNGAFPDTIPSPLLGGLYTYSGVTMTDGTYNIRVATGVGTYRMYAYMMWNGALSLVEQVGPVGVTPGANTTQNLVIP